MPVFALMENLTVMDKSIRGVAMILLAGGCAYGNWGLFWFRYP